MGRRMVIRWPFRPHRRWELEATAFVDGELPAPTVARFEIHMSDCPSCRARVSELREVKALVAGLPEASAPRSFAITPAMLGAPVPRPVVPATPRWAFRGAQLAAGAAFVALFAVVAFDLLATSGGSSQSASTAAPVAGAEAPESRAAAGSAQDSAGSPASKGVASPSSGASNTQSIPPANQPAAAGTSAGSQVPLLVPLPAASSAPHDAFSAPSVLPGTTNGPLSRPSEPGNDGGGATYGAIEASLLALGAAAAIAAIVFSRRSRR